MIVAMRFLVYLLLFLFPIGQLLRVQIVTNVQIVPQDILVGLIAILSISYSFKNKKIFSKNKFLLWQLLFVACGFFSLILNIYIHRDINFISSFLYTLRYLVYLNLLTVGPLFVNSKYIKKVFLTSGGIFVVAGFIQYLSNNDLSPLIYLGWDDHLYRMFSTFLDPNFAGAFYVLYFFVLLRQSYCKSLKSSYLALITSFFTLIAIYLTYSRTALIGLIAGLITFCIIKRKFKILLMSLGIASLMLILFSDKSVEGLNPLRTASSYNRLISLKESLIIGEKNPLYGVGFNAFRYAQIRYGTRTALGASLSNSDAGTDNSFLFVFVTTGLIGLGLYLSSFIVLVKMVLLEGKSSALLITIIVALFSASMFLNILFYTSILSWFFLLIALRRKFD